MPVNCVDCRYAWVLTWPLTTLWRWLSKEDVFSGMLWWCFWGWEAVWGSPETFQHICGDHYHNHQNHQAHPGPLWPRPQLSNLQQDVRSHIVVSASICFRLGGSLICTSDENFGLEREEMKTRNPEQSRDTVQPTARCGDGCCKESIFFLNCQHCLWFDGIFYLHFKLFTHY